MFKNFAKGLLFGAVAGAAGGLLLAPRSGQETRKKLKNDINEMTDLTLDVNDSLTEFKSALETTIITAKELLPPFQEGVEKDLRNFQFQMEPRLQQINEQLEVLESHLPDSPKKQGLQRFYLKRPN